MLAIDLHRTSGSDDPGVGVGLLLSALLFKFNFFHLPIYELFNKLLRLLAASFVVVHLALIRKNHVRLFRASSVLDCVSTSYTLAVFNHMMLRGCILHCNESLSGRNLSLIELGALFIEVFVLECSE